MTLHISSAFQCMIVMTCTWFIALWSTLYIGILNIYSLSDVREYNLCLNFVVRLFNRYHFQGNSGLPVYSLVLLREPFPFNQFGFLASLTDSHFLYGNIVLFHIVTPFCLFSSFPDLVFLQCISTYVGMSGPQFVALSSTYVLWASIL
jgi:hypothetical protein